jgi:VWFA-related protein
MRHFFPRSLHFTLLLSLLFSRALAQDVATVRIGIPPLITNANQISATQARDRLVKDLNRHKVDKKWNIKVDAVSLAAADSAQAMAEAKQKNCQFLLSIRLAELKTSEKNDPSAFGGTGGMVPVFGAKTIYQLRRVLDGAPYATGSGSVESSPGPMEAVLEAMDQIVSDVIAELKRGGNVPHAEVAAAPKSELSPRSIEVQMLSPDFCKWLPTDIPHAAALRGVCEYAISLPQKMPNFICDQQTSRYRGENLIPRDMITALVRYEDGNETYSEIKLNGKPAPSAITNSPGLWSTGEFGSNLRAIFDVRNNPVFEYTGDNSLNNRAVWVFTYRIVHQNDALWRLHAGSDVLAPPYGGELWVDQKTGELLRFGAAAKEIPADFGMQKAELSTDYDDVAFQDGTSFLLPAQASVATKFRGEETTRNVLEFRNCHKFRAKTRMVTDIPLNMGEFASAPNRDEATEVQRALDEQQQIYAILREQAVRDNAARMEVEQIQDLQASRATTYQQLIELEKKRREIVAQEIVAAHHAAPAGNKDTPVFKATVNLVPVSVVLRDSKGHAVGGLRKEDFQLFDGKKPQPITSFTIEASGEGATLKEPAGNTSESFVSSPRPKPRRYVAYLFDDVHARFEDLASAGSAAAKHFAAMPPGTQAGVFVSSGQLGLNFTSNREKLAATLKSLQPHPILRGSLCPRISPYMAELIVNESDLEALALATQDAQRCAAGGGLDPRIAERIARTTAFEVMSATSAETQSTLGILREVLERTAAQPGDRTLVLVSPGFLMLGPETRQGIMDLTDTALRSGVVVNTLDVQGLTTPLPEPSAMHSSQPVVRFRYDREEAALRTDVMGDLAYSTGGTFFHNNNDMEEGFRRTADAPEYIYVLGFTPQKLDGKFHKLKVILAPQAYAGKKLDIQARPGYIAVKPGAERQ